jgi:hypothetical protein
MNFIDDFLEFTKDAESPTSFLSWSAICAIGATMRDNIYLDKGMGQRIYANLYVILCARSGACRKGVPLKVTQGLLQQVRNTKIISGRTSIQAVLKTLSENLTNPTPNAKGDFMIGGASGILYSEELAAFLVDDKATIPILTDIYDYHEEWTNNLKASDTERLKNVVVSMLAASNLDLLKEVYTSAANYGGLLARTVLIMEEKRRQKNSRVFYEPNPNADRLKNDLILHLRKVAAAKGRMKYNQEAAEAYDEWYQSIDDSTFGRSGVEARIHTTIEKVAMCLAMSESEFDLIIHKKHVEEAIDLCMPLIPNYQYLTMAATSNMGNKNGSTVHHEILIAILKAPSRQLTSAQILRKFLGNIDIRGLTDFGNSMVAAQLLEMIVENGGITFRAGKRLIERFEKNKED